MLYALPPEYQIKREKEAIFNDPRLHELLGDLEIRDIQQIDNQHSYIVVTEECELQVDIIYLPRDSHWVGPANFCLSFHEPIWKKGQSSF